MRAAAIKAPATAQPMPIPAAAPLLIPLEVVLAAGVVLPVEVVVLVVKVLLLDVFAFAEALDEDEDEVVTVGVVLVVELVLEAVVVVEDETDFGPNVTSTPGGRVYGVLLTTMGCGVGAPRIDSWVALIIENEPGTIVLVETVTTLAKVEAIVYAAP